jgi:hypothetical protein
VENKKLIVSSIILLFISSLFVGFYWLGRNKVKHIEIYNISDSSAQLTWIGSEPHSAEIKVIPSAMTYRVDKSSTGLNTLDLNGLEPDSEYTATLKTGLFTESVEVNFRTKKIAAKPKTPIPIYGEIISNEFVIDDGYITVYFIDDEAEVIKSGAIFENGTYSADLSNIIKRGESKNSSKFISIHAVDTDGVWYHKVTSVTDTFQPVKTLELTRDDIWEFAHRKGITSPTYSGFSSISECISSCESGCKSSSSSLSNPESSVNQACINGCPNACQNLISEQSSNKEENEESSTESDSSNNDNRARDDQRETETDVIVQENVGYNPQNVPGDPCPNHSPGSFDICNRDGTCKFHCQGDGDWYMDSSCSLCEGAEKSNNKIAFVADGEIVSSKDYKPKSPSGKCVMLNGRKVEVENRHSVTNDPGTGSPCGIDVPAPIGTNVPLTQNYVKCSAWYGNGCQVTLTLPDGSKETYAHTNEYTRESCEDFCSTNSGVYKIGDAGTNIGAHVHYQRYTSSRECVDPCQKFGGCFSCDSSAIAVGYSSSSSPNSYSRDSLVNSVHAASEEDVKASAEGRIEYIKQGLYIVQGSNITTDIARVDQDSKVVYFNDENQNGIFDLGETALSENEADELIEIQFEKHSEVLNYELTEGWNLVSIPQNIYFDSTEPISKSHDLLEFLNSRNENITHLASYIDGSTKITTSRKDTSHETVIYGDNFDVNPGKGYMLKSNRNFTLSIGGKLPKNSLPIELYKGWNLVGVFSEQDYTSYTILNALDNSNIPADIISRRESGIYLNTAYEDDKFYGKDFEMDRLSGYWIRIGDDDSEVSEDSYIFTP